MFASMRTLGKSAWKTLNDEQEKVYVEGKLLYGLLQKLTVLLSANASRTIENN